MYKPPKRKAFSKEDRAAVYVKTGGRCAYCGIEIKPSQMQIDHVFPVMLGGTDDMRNLMPTCRSCNNYKSTLTLSKFRNAVERWPFVLARDNVTYRNAVRFGMVKPIPHDVTFYFERIGIQCDEWGATEGGGEG